MTRANRHEWIAGERMVTDTSSGNPDYGAAVRERANGSLEGDLDVVALARDNRSASLVWRRGNRIGRRCLPRNRSPREPTTGPAASHHKHRTSRRRKVRLGTVIFAIAFDVAMSSRNSLIFRLDHRHVPGGLRTQSSRNELSTRSGGHFEPH
jgi:hypothetical protein